MHESIPHGGTVTIPQVTIEADDPAPTVPVSPPPRAGFPGTAPNEQAAAHNAGTSDAPKPSSPTRGRFAKARQAVGRRLRAVPTVGAAANTRFKVAVLLSFVALVSALVANKVRQGGEPPGLEVPKGSSRAGKGQGRETQVARNAPRADGASQTPDRPNPGAMPEQPASNPPEPVAATGAGDGLMAAPSSGLPPIPEQGLGDRDAVVPASGTSLVFDDAPDSDAAGEVPPDDLPVPQDDLPAPLAGTPPEPIALAQPGYGPNDTAAGLREPGTVAAAPDGASMAAPGQGLLEPGATTPPEGDGSVPSSLAQPATGPATTEIALPYPPTQPAEAGQGGTSAASDTPAPGPHGLPLAAPEPGAAAGSEPAASQAAPSQMAGEASPVAPFAAPTYPNPSTSAQDAPLAAATAPPVDAPATGMGVREPLAPDPTSASQTANAASPPTGNALSARLEPGQLRLDPVPEAARGPAGAEVDATPPPPATGTTAADASPPVAMPRANPATAGEADEPVVGARIEPLTHIVRRGENFYTISRYYYGSGRYWRALWSANRDQVPRYDELYVGTSLRVPAPEELDRGLIDPPGAASSAASSSGRDGAGVFGREPASRDASAARTALASDRDKAPIPDEGVALDLPVAPGASGTAPGDSAASGTGPEARDSARRGHARAYTVRTDYETFRTVARDQLRDTSRADEVYRLNTELVSSPDDYIPRGTRIRLPEPAARR